ncbi:two-component system regulatory protein YycI [Virgibacillus salexigens]|uniref:Regulatory protein YycH-like domain-containing protein n=1 Tax=Virgibacillus kapii TaxID=1638645 RepID=A0ABQ2DFF7_9BACI|nr:two-component system regulatory protein YycI [Virgibacillus kapii]GGJ56142.1 hypothetical protein GCM10007111_18000 [Virgibacillus kapii]
MQWNQIKTLFILCFIVLNIYLFVQFLEKQDRTSYETYDSTETTIEDQLEQENIKISADLDVLQKDSIINVAPKEFTEKEAEQIEGLKNQDAQIIDNNLIVSHFEEPVPIPENASEGSIAQQVKSYTAFTDEFTYWGWDQQSNILIFFQTKNDRPIYYNRFGSLLVYLNEDNEMVYYTQATLGKDEELGGAKNLSKPISAISTLFRDNQIVQGDEVTFIENGYYTRIESDTGTQVFAPNYRITVNDEKNFFVNAMELFVSTDSDTKFISETISKNLSLYKRMNDDVEWKDAFVKYVDNLVVEESIKTKRSEGE